MRIFKSVSKVPRLFTGECYLTNANLSDWDSNLFVIYYLGKRHCETGPAIIRYNGVKEWYYDDRRHRLDGPAIEELVTNGFVYYIHGVGYTEEQYLQHPLVIKTKLDKIVEL